MWRTYKGTVCLRAVSFGYTVKGKYEEIILIFPCKSLKLPFVFKTCPVIIELLKNVIDP